MQDNGISHLLYELAQGKGTLLNLHLNIWFEGLLSVYDDFESMTIGGQREEIAFTLLNKKNRDLKVLCPHLKKM